MRLMSKGYTVRGQGELLFKGCLIAGGCIFVIMMIAIAVAA